MKYPCNDCPFRKDNIFDLPYERKKGILDALLNDGFFHCHLTLDYNGDEFLVTDKSKACFGAALFLENILGSGCRANLSFRLALMFGDFTLKGLRKHSAVFESEEEFLA